MINFYEMKLKTKFKKKDLQIRLMDIQKECYYLRCELDNNQQKLTASMQSIKHFWSPELKRERQLRKDETSKLNCLTEQYKQLQNQYTTITETYELQLQQLQTKLDQKCLSNIDDSAHPTLSLSSSSSSNLNVNVPMKQLVKEKNILKKTITELEMRINAQKQTIGTKDETIKNLFQLIKTFGNNGSGNESTTKQNSDHLNSSNLIHIINELETMNQQLDTANNSNYLLTEQNNKMRERLNDEEFKNSQLQQFIQQLQQQKSSLMTQLAVSTSTHSNLAKTSMNNDNHLTNNDYYLNEQQQQQQSPSQNLLIEAKDVRMKQLESQVQQLQEEINSNKISMQRLTYNLSTDHLYDGCGSGSGGVGGGGSQSVQGSPHHHHHHHHHRQQQQQQQTAQIDLLKTNEKYLKDKIETLKQEVSRKETEIQQLKTRYETSESKEKDLQHYLVLLKESVTTKDQQIGMQQTEINELRNRQREKDSFIEKKNQQLQSIQIEKHQCDSDINELRDQMEIKERKISVLNRKIDNLEEQLKDKEMQITTLRTKLNMGSSSVFNSNVMQTLEQSLEQKDKIIDKLTKEIATNRNNKSLNNENFNSINSTQFTEQIETLNISIRELTERCDAKNKEIQENQNEIYDLKDEVESYKTQLLRKDSHVNSLELSLTQKNDEIEMMEEKIQFLMKQQQLMANSQSNKSSSTSVEVENLKKQTINLQKDIQMKDIKIQQLSNELITLKELIDDFEEQKQVLKEKLEQQHLQFGKLEKQFEQTSTDFEKQLAEQRDIYEEQLQMASQNQNNKREENNLKEWNDKEASYRKQIESLKKSINDKEANFNKQIDAYKKQLIAREKDIQTLSLQISEREVSLNKQFSENESSLNKLLQEKEKEIEIIKNNKIDSSSELDRIKNELEDYYRTDMANREAQFNKQLEENKSDYEAKLLAKEANFKEELSQMDSLFTKEINEMEAQLAIAQASTLNNDQNDNNNELDSLRKLINDKKEKETALKEQIESYKKIIQDHQDTTNNLNVRIKDLEEALRESVSITAEREYVFAQQKKKTEKLEIDNKTQQDELDRLNKELDEQHCKYQRVQDEMGQRDQQLQKLEEEKVKEMNEILVTK
jgi:ELKS/RAB6-interacting/CAST family member 1